MNTINRTTRLRIDVPKVVCAIRSSWPCLQGSPCGPTPYTIGQMQGFPIPEQGVSVHAWGLRPHRVCIRLAIAASAMPRCLEA
jgi:hypothetical protein